jgi:hypothetical protein
MTTSVMFVVIIQFIKHRLPSEVDTKIYKSYTTDL